MRVGDYELSGTRVQTLTLVHNRIAPAREP
jgi:hypothetical protein